MSISRKSLFLLSFFVVSNMYLATSTSVKPVYIEHIDLDNNSIKQQTKIIDTAEKFVLKPTALSYPSHLNIEQVYHDAEGFHVICNGQTHDIEHGYVDNIIRNMTNQQLAYFQERGRIQICESTECLLSLKAYVLLRGGGPLAAKFFYWLVKALGYGVPAAAASVGIATAIAPLAAKSAVAGAIKGGSLAAGEAVIGTAAATLVGGGNIATGGAAVAGGTVVGALGAEGAFVATGAAYVGAGCSASGYITFVETSAAAAGAIGLACWFLP